MATTRDLQSQHALAESADSLHIDLESFLMQTVVDANSLNELFTCNPSLIPICMDIILKKDDLFRKIFSGIFSCARLLRNNPEIVGAIVDKLIAQKESYPLIVFKVVLPELAPAIDPILIQSEYPSFNTLPLASYVIPQRGNNCLYYALSMVLIMYGHFLPARKRDYHRRFECSLRQLGKEVGIEGVGGVFDLREVIDLLAFVNFIGEIVIFQNLQDLKKLVKLAVDKHVPILIPYNRLSDKDTGQNAHYAVIIGYYDNTHGDFDILITHDGKCEIFNAQTLFTRNNNLLEFPTCTFAKKMKKEPYQLITPEKKAEYYKTYTYPNIDLRAKLKNRLLLISSPSHKAQLKQDEMYQNTLKAFKK